MTGLPSVLSQQTTDMPSNSDLEENAKRNYGKKIQQIYPKAYFDYPKEEAGSKSFLNHMQFSLLAYNMVAVEKLQVTPAGGDYTT